MEATKEIPAVEITAVEDIPHYYVFTVKYRSSTIQVKVSKRKFNALSLDELTEYMLPKIHREHEKNHIKQLLSVHNKA